jgi:hypothetical protein
LLIKSQNREAFWSMAAQSDLLSPSGMLSHLPACAKEHNDIIKSKIRRSKRIQGGFLETALHLRKKLSVKYYIAVMGCPIHTLFNECKSTSFRK